MLSLEWTDGQKVQAISLTNQPKIILEDSDAVALASHCLNGSEQLHILPKGWWIFMEDLESGLQINF